MQEAAGAESVASIMYEASGWANVRVAVTRPDGRTNADGGFSGLELNAGNTGQNFDEVGVWRVRFEDPEVDCLADFLVEVYPPGTTLTG